MTDEASSPELPDGPIDHPAAWHGDTLAAAPEQWIDVLTDTETAELETAAHDYLARNETIGEITPGDFPLPTLGVVCTPCGTR